MKKVYMQHNGDPLNPDTVALVAGREDGLLLLMPVETPNRKMSRSEVLLAALAMRCSDDDWIEEQLDYIAEVRRSFKALDAEPKKLN